MRVEITTVRRYKANVDLIRQSFKDDLLKDEVPPGNDREVVQAYIEATGEIDLPFFEETFNSEDVDIG